MRRKTIILLLAAVILFPGFAGAVSEKDFEVQTTENIVILCTTATDDPLYHMPLTFATATWWAHTTTMKPRHPVRKEFDWSVHPIRCQLETIRSTCSSIGPKRIRSTGESRRSSRSSGS